MNIKTNKDSKSQSVCTLVWKKGVLQSQGKLRKISVCQGGHHGDSNLQN